MSGIIGGILSWLFETISYIVMSCIMEFIFERIGWRKSLLLLIGLVVLIIVLAGSGK